MRKLKFVLYLKEMSSFQTLLTEVRLAYNRNFDLTFHEAVRTKKENLKKDFSSIMAALDSYLRSPPGAKQEILNFIS